MVIGLLAIAAIPTVTGVSQAISAQKKANAASKDQEKFHLTAMIKMGNEFREGAFCVLKDNKILLDLPDYPIKAHRFCGHYFKYPSEEAHLGLVSTIADDPPMLNWIYVNKETRQLQYGGKKDTLGHVIGPWFWSADEHFITLEGDHEPFVARLVDGQWCVCWDPEQELEDCLRLKLRRRLLMGMESKYVRDSER